MDAEQDCQTVRSFCWEKQQLASRTGTSFYVKMQPTYYASPGRRCNRTKVGRMDDARCMMDISGPRRRNHDDAEAVLRKAVISIGWMTPLQWVEECWGRTPLVLQQCARVARRDPSVYSTAESHQMMRC